LIINTKALSITENRKPDKVFTIKKLMCPEGFMMARDRTSLSQMLICGFG